HPRAVAVRGGALDPHGADLVVQAVDGPQHPVRPRSRGIRSTHPARGPVERAARRVVATVPAHVDVATAITLALVHAACLPARGTGVHAHAPARVAIAPPPYRCRVHDDAGIRLGGARTHARP